MEEFSKKKILSSQTLGDKLRRSRGEANLTLYTVAKKIKVKEEYLHHLENGQYNKLPSPLYIKNYLKKYSEFLQLHWPTIEQMYQREMIIYQEKKVKSGTGKFNQPALLLPKILIVLVIILALTVFASYVIYEIGNFIQPPDLQIYNLPDQITVQEQTIDIAGKTEADTQVYINGQIIITDVNGNFQENITLRSGLNTIKIVAKKKHSKERVIYKQILVNN